MIPQYVHMKNITSLMKHFMTIVGKYYIWLHYKQLLFWKGLSTLKDWKIFYMNGRNKSLCLAFSFKDSDITSFLHMVLNFITGGILKHYNSLFTAILYLNFTTFKQIRYNNGNICQQTFFLNKYVLSSNVVWFAWFKKISRYIVAHCN